MDNVQQHNIYPKLKACTLFRMPLEALQLYLALYPPSYEMCLTQGTELV
jgi:hypothetical protein